MSAVAVVLPFVWGFGAASAAPESFSPGVRKGPQRVAVEHRSSLATAGAGLRAVTGARPEPFVAEPEALQSKSVRVELAFYRKYTEGLLRRFAKLSMEAGRTPSLLGQEMFRGKVTSYEVRSFDDVVIFVYDVGQCLKKLDSGQQHLIRRIAVQEYTQGETAAMLGLSLRTTARRYREAIDRLTGVFLERAMLEPLTSCQGGEPGFQEVSQS